MREACGENVADNDDAIVYFPLVSAPGCYLYLAIISRLTSLQTLTFAYKVKTTLERFIIFG